MSDDLYVPAASAMGYDSPHNGIFNERNKELFRKHQA